MKKLLLSITLAVVVLTSCSSIHYQMGQSSAAFLQQNRKKNFELVRSSQQLTVYKWVNGWSYTDPPYFFYFQNDVLTNVDRGTRSPDLIIENR